MAKSPLRLLACLFPNPVPDSSIHYDACSALQDLAPQAPSGVQVKLLVNPTLLEFQQARQDASPTAIYLSGRSHFEQNRTVGALGPLRFGDEAPQGADAVTEACAGVELVYLDCAQQEGLGAKLSAVAQHVVAWPEQGPAPAVTAAQFSHTFFSSLLLLRSSVPEAFALASHVVQAHCTAGSDGHYVPPALPSFLSALKSALPDNSSIAAPSIPGLDPSTPLANSVPGWADIRLLAPRAELRLLLTGNTSLIDGSKLSFLGEALRALLVLEMRGLSLINTAPCVKTPANLPLGCTALRCEVRTTSGAEVVAILGGQPSVLAERSLVEHALRMTLVADSLSLQFRLPPMGVPLPVPRHSAAIAGGTPVVDALVLTSVWAVHVLRSLCLVPSYRPLISLGVAAVGGTATLGITALDAKRLKMIVTGQGPASITPITGATPLQPPAANDSHAVPDGIAGIMAGA